MSDQNISFAQNGEDIVLWRALKGITNGVYIDVGANHPTEMSVTRKFYNAGWSGIAVEPNHEYAELFRSERPRDFVCEAVASNSIEPSVTFHLIEGTGLSTVSGEISEEHAAAGWTVTDVDVPVVSVNTAIESGGYADRDLHFMSVDTEGSEAEVLASIDFTRFRPWVLVIEATAPLSTTQVHQSWDSAVLAAGYTFCLFDGLSRFYVADERRDLLSADLSYPASVLDEFVTIDSVHRDEAMLTLQTELHEVNLRLAETDRQLNSAHDETAALQKQNADLLADILADLEKQRVEAARLGKLVADLQQTTSWKVTKPLRSAKRLLGSRD